MQRSSRLAAFALVLVLVACRANKEANESEANALVEANEAAEAASPPASSSSSDRLIAAAEPFELLTETAFTDPTAKLDATIASGRKAIADIHALLAPAAAQKVDGLLAYVDRHRKADQRADLALSSIEIYRSIVSSVPAGTKVPSDVSLLDYAGFRYNADLKASPARWDDMTSAAAFGRERWTALAPKVTNKAVAGPFEAALAGMEKAVASKDSAAAASSVSAELEQVDKLEEYFSRP